MAHDPCHIDLLQVLGHPSSVILNVDYLSSYTEWTIVPEFRKNQSAKRRYNIQVTVQASLVLVSENNHMTKVKSIFDFR